MNQMLDTQALWGAVYGKERAYFKDVIHRLPKGPATCLDAGSGIRFCFERLVKKSRGGDAIDCLDFQAAQKVPTYVRKFYQQSLEEKFDLSNRYDVITCFEVIEHVDQTDILLKNCYRHLKKTGIFFLTVPNLASLYGRIELLFGYQPHILEVSNVYNNYGTGWMGKMNQSSGSPIHHIRGITFRAMKELLRAEGFDIVECLGYQRFTGPIFRHVPGMSSVVLFCCHKRPL